MAATSHLRFQILYGVSIAHTGPSLPPPSNPDDIPVSDDGLDRTGGDELIISKRGSGEELSEATDQKVAEEAVEVEHEGAVAATEHTSGGSGVEGAQDTWDRDFSDDGLPSPDSDQAPLTLPGLPNPPRRVFFGSISPEYLKTMWEEEGPGAWTDTGVWASKVPAMFVAASN